MFMPLYSWLASLVRPSALGENEDNPIELTAVPGLITFLDHGLFRCSEGQLTATICSSHALLWAWIDIKKQSKVILGVLWKEDHQAFHHKLYDHLNSFAHLCLEAASEAIERLSTDKLAPSANLSDPYDFNSGSHVLTGVGLQGIFNGVLESKNETGRRLPIQRRRDCWESPRLLCPDYVWADDAFLTCQKLLRTLYKHPYYVADVESFSAASRDKRQAVFSHLCEREVSLLLQLIRDDLPVRMCQFKAAMEADSAVSKRLYLVKCEYRAPFRAFLEAHQSVQRAPSLELVDQYLKLQNDPNSLEKMRDSAKNKVKNLLETPSFVDALLLEQRCEEIEIEMAKMIFPFTELARILDNRRAYLKAVPKILDSRDVPYAQETVRRLKSLLCRKAAAETSGGIRPLLLDLQGISNEDCVDPIDYLLKPGGRPSSSENARVRRVDSLIKHLKCLSELCRTRNAFHTERKSEVEIPVSIAKGCSEADFELFRCQFLDWYDMVVRQHELARETSFDTLADNIRYAEMENRVAGASSQSLGVVRQHLEQIVADREKRFEVLKDSVEEICLREMNLFVKLNAPEKMLTLELPKTSASGLFGVALQIAGEPLPIG